MTEAVLDIESTPEASTEVNTAATTESHLATPPAVLSAVSAEQLAEAIRRAGCAVQVVEEEQGSRLHSASHGVGFQVLWGNRLGPDQYLDFTLSCPLRVDGGTFPEALLADWHRSRRFARIATHGDFVVLEMDVMVTGGVSEDFLSVSLQVWIQMMGQFFLHLRNFRADAAEVADAETPDAVA